MRISVAEKSGSSRDVSAEGSRAPRVVHAPTDVANLASVTARGLRELGASATSLTYPQAFNYELTPDVVIPPARLARLGRVARSLTRCDVLHLYGGESCFRGRLYAGDARVMRRLGRRVVMEFVGSDIVIPAIEQSRNAYYVPPAHLDVHLNRRRGELWAEICEGHTIVGDHSLDIYLKLYFEHIHVVSHRIDTGRFKPSPPSRTQDVPVIVHAPSSPLVKGTEVVRRVLGELSSNGARFEYVEVQGMPHRKALEQYARADLVVDQLRVGTYGQFAVEAMSLAKPVVGFVLPELVPLFPELPVINANPDTLLGVLESWIARPQDRHELGLASRAYAERWHDVRVVASRLLEIYELLPRRAFRR